MWIAIGRDFVNLSQVVWIQDASDASGLDLFLHLPDGKSVRAEGAEGERIKRLLGELVNERRGDITQFTFDLDDGDEPQRLDRDDLAATG
jgi:hypothetical protein